MTTKKRRKPLTKAEKVEIVQATLDRGKEVLLEHISAFTKITNYLRKKEVIDDRSQEVKLAVTKVKRKKYIVCFLDTDGDSIWGIVEMVPDDPYAYGSMFGGSFKYDTRGFIRDSEFVELSKQ